MKFIRDDAYYRNKELTVEEAVEFATSAMPYEYSGELETLRGELDKTRALVARLVAVLHASDVLKTVGDMQEVLGSCVDVRAE